MISLRGGLLGLLLLFHLGAFAQESKKLSWNDQFILDKTGKHYPAKDSLVSLNNKVYNFNSPKSPAFVYISSESCLPCKFELPLYIEACKKYPQIDFVYFDTDLDPVDTAVIVKKFGADFNLPNLYIFTEPYSYFYERQLFLGFPTKYFMDSNGIVATVQLGGWTVEEKVWAEWLPVLLQLK